MRGDGGVVGEGRVVGVPKFHSWGKCTMPLMNINSDWMPNASSGLCIYYTGPLKLSAPWGCKLYMISMFCHSYLPRVVSERTLR